MKKAIQLLAAFLALVIALPVEAQVQMQLRMGFPAVLPPLVVVQPGLRVVQDFDEEIFFSRGYYWVRRDAHWYRTRDHRGTWRYVRDDRVPAPLRRHEPGRYRHWQHDERRAWPEAHQGRSVGRHWKQTDRRELQPQPGDRHPGRGDRGRDGDGHRRGRDGDGDRRGRDGDGDWRGRDGDGDWRGRDGDGDRRGREGR
ncbi:MAG: hypothetical protein HZB56_08330 [Deltaproteobacteria bacterium]|nr:hypothetical protein [Deltaproteobacteria bacterium]